MLAVWKCPVDVKQRLTLFKQCSGEDLPEQPRIRLSILFPSAMKARAVVMADSSEKCLLNLHDSDSVYGSSHVSIWQIEDSTSEFSVPEISEKYQTKVIWNIFTFLHQRPVCSWNKFPWPLKMLTGRNGKQTPNKV